MEIYFYSSCLKQLISLKLKLFWDNISLIMLEKVTKLGNSFIYGVIAEKR